MIYNKCIYGTIRDSDGELITNSTVKLLVVNSTFEIVLEKSYTNETGYYQFNLGDSDMLGFNNSLPNELLIVITNSIDDDVTFSDGLELFDSELVEYGIIDTGSVDTTDTESNGDSSTETMITQALVLVEDAEDLLNSWLVYSVVDDEEIFIQASIGKELLYRPKEIGTYRIKQKSINKTTSEMSEKVYDYDISTTAVIQTKLDLHYYGKKKKVVTLELPKFVYDTILLEDGWYKKFGKVMGRPMNFKLIKMPYAFGEVIIHGTVGDIYYY